MRQIWLIAKAVLIEAVRRKEIYAIIAIALLVIFAVSMMDFFKLEGISKFYREVALKVMTTATAITTIVLAARQLPREFEHRTIYPLLAKPISRWKFLLGKLLGVMFSAAFCLGLFMIVFFLGSLYLKAHIPWGLTGQFLYLQMISLLILASLSFWLSLMLNLDAAITTGLLFFATSSVITTATSFLYDWVSGFGKALLLAVNYLLPQLTLFDLSEKTVHAEAWKPLPTAVILDLTLYGGIYIVVYWALTNLWFRRRAL